MQFGFCYISDYHQREHGSFAGWYRRLLHEWQTADTLGYDALWIAEHRLAGYGFGSTPVVAQAIADRTEQIRIGTAVSLLPQRHPVLTAEDWAAVDVLSGGRLNFGIGRGIFAYDFAAVGVDSSESRARFQEAWEIIRRLWTEDGVSYRGRYWSLDGHTLGPKPLQKPTPPVYVACIATPDSYRWAGAEGCHLMVAPFLLKSTEQQCEYLAIYREALTDAGHDPSDFQVLANYHLAIDDNEQGSADADRYIFRYLEFMNGIHTDPRYTLDSKQYAAYESGASLWQDAQELRDRRAVVGTPQQCVDRMGELADACGLTGWMFHINYGGVPHERVIDQMHIFAEEVRPSFETRPPPPAGRERRTETPEQTMGEQHVLTGRARRITELATSYTRSCVLFAAHKLDLFSAIGPGGKTSAEVAQQVRLDPRATARLLDACASLGLLAKQNSSYFLSDDSQEMLVGESPHYLGDWIAHWADMMVKGNWQQLAEHVRAGEPLPVASDQFSFDSDRDPLRNWVVGMHEMGVAGHAEIIAAVESLADAKTLLDVGGGPGTYSMAMCRRHPQLRAVILDSPEVSGVAQRLVDEAGLGDRIRFVHGDFCQVKLGQTFDAILLSNVLHMGNEAGATAMLRNAAHHLNPHGILVVQEWMIDDHGTAPELSTLFNLHMLINPNGDLYRVSQLRNMIEQAGFSLLQTIDTGGVYDVMIARKNEEDEITTR